MKKLVIVRHGDYDYEDRLSELGKQQISDLSEKLAGYVNGDTLLIFSSPALRASESAKIIAGRLGIEFEEHNVLWSGEDGKVSGWKKDFEVLMGIITSHPQQANVVVLVTHYEYVEDFPFWFGKNHLQINLPCKVIPKGTAYVIDCEKKEISHVF